jgi:hypothetical protein
MNNPLLMTAACWETRNGQHTHRAVQWCKNYGLQPLTATLYIGQLRKSERTALLREFEKVFLNKTETFHLLVLCQSCYSNAELHRLKHDEIVPPPFEIIG